MPALDPSTIQSFLDYLKFEKRYSAHTVTSYHTDLEDFYAFTTRIFGDLPLDGVTHTFIRSWLADMKERGLSSRSINRKISAVRSFFKYYVKRGTIQVMPTNNLKMPKISKRLPVFVKEQEAQDLLASLKSGSEDWRSLNAKMLFTLFYGTGMRLSELIQLKEQQLDLGRSQIKVLGKGNKERIIPIAHELVNDIRDYQQLKKKEFAEPAETLLVTEKGAKLYPKYAYLLVKASLGQAGTLDKKSPHVLRHTFATHLMNNGADLNAVKELLGHASLAATQVYTHNTIEKLKEVYRNAHPKA